MKSNKIFEYRFEENTWKELVSEDNEADERIKELEKDMNEYDVITDTMMETWTNLPRARTNHTAAYFNKGMYIFGGSDESNNKLNDLWKYDLEKNRWIIINHISTECDDGQPTKRSGHASNVIGDKMYIFGGLEGITHETNDFFSFDFKTETWKNIQLKVSNPEDIKSNFESNFNLNQGLRDDAKKSISKPQNLSLYGLDSRYNRAMSPLSK